MESEEKWGEPSDAELETLIEDRLAEGPLDSEPMTMRPPLTNRPSPVWLCVPVLGLLVRMNSWQTQSINPLFYIV